jgi:succinate-semialdehyde dehydrogenase/glutarate-semialdehyde dehydrogenase
MLISVNPATGREIARHAELTPAQVDQKLTQAREAFLRWRRTEITERAALLSCLGDVYDANKARLARMATEEMGKTLVSATAEVEKCIACFWHYAKRGPEMLETEQVRLLTGGNGEIHFLPLGVVLAIMPWNFPYWQVVRFLAPAILAGNAGLLKHASNVQGVAGLIEEMMYLAGAPAELFQNLAVKSSSVAAIIADDRVAAVTLTGSEGAGVAVAEEAGRQLKKVVLELGGSDPFIVMPSADLDKAAASAVKARVQNTGQSCICAKRMIVHEDIYTAFLEKFSAAMRAVKAGDPMDKETDMGPLSSAGQLETVLKQLEEAKRLGAKLEGGEKLRGPGAFISAGILTEVKQDSPLVREEIFGPIAMVFRAKDIDEAIAIANNVPFGLGSSVWTNDPTEQAWFIRDIEAGMTAINQVLASSPEVPFGGVKHSGHGRELGPYGLHEFMNVKTVLRAA